MSETKLLCARCSLLLDDVLFCALAIRFFGGRRAEFPLPPFAVWMAGAVLGLLVNTLIRRKEGTVNASVFFTAALGTIMGIFINARMYPGDFSFWRTVCVFIAGAGPVIHSGILVHEKWKYDRQVLYLDGMIAASAALLLCEQLDSFPEAGRFLAWTVPALGINILVLILCRLQGTGVSAGIPLALLAACAGCAWAGSRYLQLFAKGTASAVLLIRDLFLRLLRGAANAVETFIKWLADLLPAAEQEMDLPDAAGGPGQMSYTLPEPAGPGPVLFILAAALVLLAVGIWVWRMYRGIRWHSRPVSGGAESAEQRNRIRGRRKNPLSALLEKLSFSFRYLRHRNSPEGLLTYTEKMMAEAGQPREKGESAPGFLRRCALLQDREGSEMVIRLADCLEQSYYRGMASASEPGFAGKYRKAVRGKERSQI